MDGTSGRPVPPPASFRVTRTRLGKRYNYYIDDDSGYIKRVARDSTVWTPTTYYRLHDSSPKVKRRLPKVSLVRAGFALVALIGIGLVSYPYYPSVAYQVQKQVATNVTHQVNLASAPAQISETNHLTIPKIGVDTQILEGSSLDVLDHEDGVWHQTGTLQNGNLVLAGHRFKYLPPNTSTLYNLHDMSKGDTIIVDWYKTRYTYVVDLVETIPSTQTKILKQDGGPRLTIYTCTNASQTMRTVVLAHRVS